MTTELSTQQQQQQPPTQMQAYCFSNLQSFELAQRMATVLSKATLVPKEYINNIPNCMIALEVAYRLNASPTMVMQNLHVINGRPSWSAAFVISAVNSCGRFSPLEFHLDGEGDNLGCYVSAEGKNGKTYRGTRITIGMAKKEGWYAKNGSKWQTMPEQMLYYRAASFFGRVYAPDVLMGMYTSDEVEDMGVKDITPTDNSTLEKAILESQSIQEIAPQKKENKKDKLETLLEPRKADFIPNVAEIMTLDGEIKKFPDEIDTIEIMKMIQDSTDQDRQQFVAINSAAFPALITYMKVDKPAAAGSLEKLLEKHKGGVI